MILAGVFSFYFFFFLSVFFFFVCIYFLFVLFLFHFGGGDKIVSLFDFFTMALRLSIHEDTRKLVQCSCDIVTFS